MSFNPYNLSAPRNVVLENPSPELPVVTPIMTGAKADGVSDDTVAIQKALDYIGDLGGGEVLFTPGTYLISDTLTVSDNTIVRGINATITGFIPEQQVEFISIDKTDGVSILGIKFDGGGSFSATPFENPYAAGQSVGFTNASLAIYGGSGTKNFRVDGCEITGCGLGMEFSYTTGPSWITNNTISNFGQVGIEYYGSGNAAISGNKISGGQGNMTQPGDTNLANSKFADGVYLVSVSKIAVLGNEISDCIRIGIVLEKAAANPQNHQVTIQGNVLYNFHDSRGSENNAGIWAEPGQSDATCQILGNTIDQTGAVQGTGGLYCIQLSDGILCSGNSCAGASVGISARNSLVVGNLIYGANGPGIQTSGTATDLLSIKDNTIRDNLDVGIRLYQSRGIIDISGNIIKDNGGGGAASQSRGHGITISRSYNDQWLSIQGNKFISSADSGDTSGQLYSIYAIGGGTVSYDMRNWMNNQFIFTGDVGTYPTNLGQTPCAFAYDNTGGSVTPYDIVNEQFNNNNNTKQLQVNSNSYGGGYQRYIGQSTAAPTTGAHLKGDWLYNSNPTAGGFMGWKCTADGTPGTWKTFGPISS